MDSYLKQIFLTGFTGLSGFFLDLFPEEKGQTLSPAANKIQELAPFGFRIDTYYFFLS
jgi:hypothetical protein